MVALFSSGIYMKVKHFLWLLLLLPMVSSAMEVLGYAYRSDSISHLLDDDILQQNSSISHHLKSIQIITPQAYQINEKGTMWGEVDPLLLNLANQHKIKIMPLITNVDYDPTRTHELLSNPAAVQRAIQQMVLFAKSYPYSGFQIDFEHIPMKDQKLFDDFMTQAAAAMHAAHFQLSVAIIPRVTDAASSDAQRSNIEHWSGAYDYPVLGKACDFVTLMAYDQHGDGTTPGPASPPNYLQQVIQYALQYIPADKLSLGIATHASYWFNGYPDNSLRVTEADLTYPQIQYLIQKFNIKIVWNDREHYPYGIFNHNNLNEYVFPENAAMLKTQIALVHQYHLRGIALWRLGSEDPALWSLLNTNQT